MVIADKYYWLHLGKTGGSTIQRVFQKLQDVDTSIQMHRRPGISHITEERIQNSIYYNMTKDKNKILSIRRLPQYLHSNAQWMLYKNQDQYTRQDLLENKWGDAQLNRYVFEIEPIHWIRTEFLFEDLFAALENYFQIPDEKKDELKQIHSNKQRYKKIDFTPEELEMMYQNNPYWAEIEEKVYGDLLI